jgi:rod shape-determining protein MreC
VKDNSHSINRIAAPIRNVAQRFAFIALLLAAVALMMFGKVDVAVTERLRASVTDAVTPILNVVSKPVASFNSLIEEARGLLDIRAENQRLVEEKERLLQWQAVARKLDAENKNLRRLLNFVTDPQASFISARVIADTGGAFANSAVINAGERVGVRKGQAAITGDGLVGRVTDVGERSARVLLISDLNSRIPVVIQSSQALAILAGDNSHRPRLIHLAPGALVSQGDRIVTSGHGGAFPPGLPVGVVASVSDRGISVEPFVDRSRITYLRILDYGLTGIVDAPPIEGAAFSSRGKKLRN